MTTATIPACANKSMPVDDLIGYLSPTTLAAAWVDVYLMTHQPNRPVSQAERMTLGRLRLALVNLVGVDEASRMLSDSIA